MKRHYLLLLLSIFRIYLLYGQEACVEIILYTIYIMWKSNIRNRIIDCECRCKRGLWNLKASKCGMWIGYNSSQLLIFRIYSYFYTQLHYYSYSIHHKYICSVLKIFRWSSARINTWNTFDVLLLFFSKYFRILKSCELEICAWNKWKTTTNIQLFPKTTK